MRMACGCYRLSCRWWVAPNTLLSWELSDFSGVVSGFFVCFKQNAEMRRLWCFFQVLSFVVGFFENIIKNPMVFAKMGVKNNMFFFMGILHRKKIEDDDE